MMKLYYFILLTINATCGLLHARWHGETGNPINLFMGWYCTFLTWACAAVLIFI